MWIVSIDDMHYPWIERFDNYEYAKERYEELLDNQLLLPNHQIIAHSIYLAEVKEYYEDYTYLDF